MAKLKEGTFNGLEIITGLMAKRFLGIPYLSVVANSRHIQESLYLVPFENRAPAVTAAVAPSEAPLLREVLTKQDAALVQFGQQSDPGAALHVHEFAKLLP